MSIDYLSGCFCEFRAARIANVAEIDEVEAFAIVEEMEKSDVDSLGFPERLDPASSPGPRALDVLGEL
jgi:hypothetical protein